jgi:hypothetical protein
MPYLENQELPERSTEITAQSTIESQKKFIIRYDYNILAMNMRLKPTIIATNFVSVDPALS